MRWKSGGLAAVFALWLVSGTAAGTGDAPAASDGTSAPTWGRTPFVIGAPGRLDSAGDRRVPRLLPRSESAVAAYADVEVVQDPTWLRHEIEHYARRAVDCAGLTPSWCRRTVRRCASGRVIDLAAGEHAEWVWLSGADRAVRLGWRRIVETSTGTMTVDAPPADFAAAMLADFPSRLEGFEFDAARERAWGGAEVDRLLYYVDQVIVALPAVVADAHRRRAVLFVEDALMQIGQLRALPLEQARLEPDSFSDGAAIGPLPARLAQQLDAVRDWRVHGSAEPWCALELLSSSVRNPAADGAAQSPGLAP
jgi:hypothetical protein